MGDEIAALLPPLRRCDPLVARAARRRAPTFDARASATAWIVGVELASHDPVEQERIVDGWRAWQRHEGACIVVDSGCDVRIGRISIGPVARDALLHWLPLSQLELTLLDSGLFADDPAGAIALLLRPPTIWPREDALRARMLFPFEAGFDPDVFAAVEACAVPRVGRAHIVQLHAAVRRIEGQLPARGQPTASATIAAGCAALAADGERSRAVVARQLARYASSSRAATSRPRAG